MASNLPAYFQAASFQPPATYCAVLPDSTAFGAGVPFLIPSLAKEGLVSLSKRVSSRVGGDYNTSQLVQPGKSNIEEKQFLGSQGGEDSNFFSEVQCTLGADNKGGGRSGTDTTALRNTLADRYPKLAPLVLDEESITLALNEEYLTPGISKQLKQGDTVGEWRLDNDA